MRWEKVKGQEYSRSRAKHKVLGRGWSLHEKKRIEENRDEAIQSPSRPKNFIVRMVNQCSVFRKSGRARSVSTQNAERTQTNRDGRGGPVGGKMEKQT